MSKTDINTKPNNTAVKAMRDALNSGYDAHWLEPATPGDNKSGKQPVEKYKNRAAHSSIDAEKIVKGYSSGYGLGMRCGHNKIVVVDYDPPADDAAKKRCEAELQRLLSADGAALPPPTVLTGGGGMHWHVRIRGVVNGCVLWKGSEPHEEIRLIGQGGNAVLPPTKHWSGQRYEWGSRTILDATPALKAAAQQGRAESWDDETVTAMEPVPFDIDSIPDGLRQRLQTAGADADRSTGVYQALCALKEAGYDINQGLWLVQDSGLPFCSRAEERGPFATRTDVARIWAKHEARNPSATDEFEPMNEPKPQVSDGLVLRTAASVPMQAIRWLWEGWIARGYLNLIAGETGAAKSTVIADIASRVTTGEPWPDEDPIIAARRKPAKVLWLGTEDGMSELTGPRLAACGANRERVIEITGVLRQGRRDLFSMQDDVGKIRRLLNLASEAGDPFEMLVIDPVTSYLSGERVKKVDLSDNGQLRSILEPWLVLAQQTGIAIVCVTHLAKNVSRQLLHRVLGAGVFTHTARSVLAVVKLPAEGEHERAMLQVKSNLPGANSGAFRFAIKVARVGTDSETGKPIEATRPKWRDQDQTLTPGKLAGGERGPTSTHGPAFVAWLRAHFRDEPGEFKRVTDVKKLAQEDIGFADIWWENHSGQYVHKENILGTWMCRPTK